MTFQGFTASTRKNQQAHRSFKRLTMTADCCYDSELNRVRVCIDHWSDIREANVVVAAAASEKHTHTLTSLLTVKLTNSHHHC